MYLCIPKILSVLNHRQEWLGLGHDRPVLFSAGPVDGAVQAHVAAGSGKRRAEAASDCRASQVEVAAPSDKLGPLVFCYSLSPVPIDP